MYWHWIQCLQNGYLNAIDLQRLFFGMKSVSCFYIVIYCTSLRLWQVNGNRSQHHWSCLLIVGWTFEYIFCNCITVCTIIHDFFDILAGYFGFTLVNMGGIIKRVFSRGCDCVCMLYNCWSFYTFNYIPAFQVIPWVAHLMTPTSSLLFPFPFPFSMIPLSTSSMASPPSNP